MSLTAWGKDDDNYTRLSYPGDCHVTAGREIEVSLVSGVKGGMTHRPST